MWGGDKEQVDFEWDRKKAVINFKKHGVDFADAALTLLDDLAVTIPDPDEGEERFITIGMDAMGRLLVVIWTWRGERLRLISARKATTRERKKYEGAR